MVVSGAVRRLALLWAGSVLIAACGAGGIAQPTHSPAQPTGIPTPTTGSAAPNMCGDISQHRWPPNGYAPAPAGLTADPVSGTTIRVRNATATDWTVLVAPWQEAGCGGWMEAMGPMLTVGAHASLDVTVPDPRWGWPLRVGVTVWDHPCDESCQDEPTGFTWLDLPAPASPT